MDISSDLIEIVKSSKREALRLLKDRGELMPVGLVLRSEGKIESFQPRGLAPMVALVEVVKYLRDAATHESTVAVAWCNPLPVAGQLDTTMELFEIHAESPRSVTSETVGFRRRLLLGWREEHSAHFPYAKHNFYVS